MLSPLRTLKDLLLALHGGAEPRHLAAGFAIGAALGLVPKGNLFAAGFFLLFFLFNVDKGMALMSAGFFTLVAYVIDPLAHAVGYALLTSGPLKGLWTALYGLPVVPWTKFNNTVVLGNLVIGLILFAPLYYGFLKALAHYDRRYRARVEAWPVVHALKGWNLFEKYKGWLS